MKRKDDEGKEATDTIDLIKIFLSFTISTSANLQKTFDEVVNNNYNGNLENLTKQFSADVTNTINNLNEYGCWCYFYDDHGRGKAQPIDAVDEMCKILHDGYECAMRDAEDEGTTCVPWEVSYFSAVGGTGLTIPEECIAANPGNNCATRACMIEGTFV